MIKMTVTTVDSDDSNESDDSGDSDDSDDRFDSDVIDDDGDSDDDVMTECVTRGEDRVGVEAAPPRPRTVCQEGHLGQGSLVRG